MPTLLRNGLRALAGVIALAWCVMCAASPSRDVDELLLDEDNTAAAAHADAQVQKAEAGGAGHEQELASALVQRAWVAVITGNLGAAGVDDDLAQAIALFQSHGNKTDLVRPLALRATRALAMGKHDECRELFTRALAIGDAPPPDRAIALSARAGYAATMADYAGALRDFEEANTIFAHRQGSAVLMLSRNLVTLSFVRYHMGDAAGARADAERALAVVALRPGVQSRAYARALSQRGMIQGQEGNYRGARRDFEAALAIQRSGTVKPSMAFAQLLQNLGNICLQTGDFAGAKRYLSEGLDVLRAMPGMDPGNVFATSGSLAEAEASLGNLEQASERLQRTLDEGAGAIGTTNDRLAGTIAILAYVRLAQGDTAASRTLFSRALELRRDRLGPSHPLLGDALVGLGNVDLAEGRFAGAVEKFEDALAIQPQLSGGNSAAMLATLGRAQALWGMGHLEEAFNVALNVERQRIEELRRNAPQMSEREGVAFATRHDSALALLLPLAEALGADVVRRQAWLAAMAERGIVTEAMAWRASQARADHEPALRASWEAWRSASANYAKAVLESERAPATSASGQVDALRVELDRAEHALADRLPATKTYAETDVPELAAALGSNDALISFASTEVRGARDPYQPYARPPRAFYAWRVDTSAAARMVRLGNDATVAAAVALWYRDLRDPATAPAVVRNDGAALRALVWDPVTDTGKARRYFIVPDGPLFRVNWSALPDGEKFLIERGYEFHLLNHERELLTQAPRDPFGHDLLIAAAPDFDAGADTGTARLRGGCADDLHFDPLPGSAREAALIEKQAARESARVLTGRGASEESLRAQAPKADNLHFATHGFARSGGCATQGTRGFDLAPATAPSPASAQGDLGALALAGANRGGGDPEHDGLLTAEEVAALDLSRVHWVVLSSCDSGLGRSVEGEGVFGLRRGFRIAGARTVIMSLWPVADAAAADWMNGLYAARFRQKLDTAAALQAATLAALNARRAAGESTHPYYWASFVAAGDWH